MPHRAVGESWGAERKFGRRDSCFSVAVWVHNLADFAGQINWSGQSLEQLCHRFHPGCNHGPDFGDRSVSDQMGI